MAPGREWVVTDIDDDTVAAAEAAARANALTVDEWVRRAIVEAFRQEALTPPATAENAALAGTEGGRPSTADDRDVTAPLKSSSESPSETLSETAAAPAVPPPQPYQPTSPATARIIWVGRLAVGFLLLLVIAGVAWKTQDQWLGRDGAPDGGESAKTAEPGLASLPTEQVPVRPAHEAPDPQETEPAFDQRQKEKPPTAEPSAKTDGSTVKAVGIGETTDAEAAEPRAPSTAGPETDPAAMPKTEAPMATVGGVSESGTVAVTVTAAAADPFAADPFGGQRMPETEIGGPTVAASEGQVATRTPSRRAPDDDVPESVAAFIEAAEAGDPDAQHDLALIYIQGLGVPRDQEAAAHWFGEAANQGNANAQYNLGVMYEQGLGLHQDHIEALLHYLTAAERGHVAAQYNAGLAYAEGKAIPRDFNEAHRWFLAAAEQGLAEAQYNLGIIYQNGLGRAKDDVAAYRYYRLAAQSGHQEAERKLAVVSARLTAAQRALADKAAAAEPPSAATEGHDMSKLDRAGIGEVQLLLKRLGYDTGAADGLSGGRTATAIRQYQQSAGLLVDGKPTVALLEHLRDAAEQ